MNNKQAVCTNVGQCSRADARTKVLVTDAQSFICEECTRPLFVLDPPSPIMYKWLLIGFSFILIILTVLVVRVFWWEKWKEEVVNPNAMQTANTPNQQQANSDEDAYSRMIVRREIKLGVLEKAVPFYYLEDGIQHKGFNYEFIKLIAADREFSNGKTLSIVVAPPAEEYDAVPKLVLQKDSRSNQYIADISMDGLTFTDGEPDPNIVYSHVYFGDQFGYSVITTREKPISNMADLRGKRVGYLESDDDVKIAAEQSAPKAKLIPLKDTIFSETDPDKRIWLQHHLETGEVDAIIYDYPYAQAEIKGSNLLISIPRISGTSLGYKIAIRKEETQLMIKINEAISRVKQTEAYRELLRKYFQSNQIQKPEVIAGGRYHTVVAGEILSTIAQKYYGDSNAWRRIEEVNRLASPDLIYIGQRLLIP